MMMGCTLYSLVPTNASRKMTMLNTNTNVDSDGSPKFYFDISIKAAAAINPTITGRSVAKTLVTAFES